MAIMKNDDFRVELVDLPIEVNALTAVDPSGYATVFLNARLSRDGQRRALKHELRHIYRNDFDSKADIRTVEA